MIIKPAAGSGDKDTPRICTRPTAIDYDCDVDLDLFVGNFGGTYNVFLGEGKGRFSPKSERVMVGEKPLSSGYHSDPSFADWDGDGDLDLITGSGSGGVMMAENVAGKGKKMSFDKTTPLIPAPKGRDSFWKGGQVLPSDSTRVAVEDLNGDGKLDLIVGGRCILKATSDGVSQEDAEQQMIVWNQDAKRILAEMHAADEGEAKKIRKQLNNHYQKRNEIMKEKSSGFVWNYRQK